MAKKKKQVIIESPVTEYFAHYDASSGTIVSVNNHLDTSYSHSVKITYEQYSNLVSGVEQFTDYYIGTEVNLQNVVTPALISKRPKVKKSFKSGMVMWADDQDDAEITIHWDEYNNKWLFLMSDSLRELLYNNRLSFNSVAFFICLNRDPNFLIRSISLDLNKLCVDKIEVPFETSAEHVIDSIGIIPSNESVSCGLKVWRMHEQD